MTDGRKRFPYIWLYTVPKRQGQHCRIVSRHYHPHNRSRVKIEFEDGATYLVWPTGLREVDIV